jgi:uncharacterized membrane protein
MSSLKDWLNLTMDPAWPWSISGIGLPALVSIALLLIMLTVWTYRGSVRANSRRVSILIALRLAALVVACLTVARPSLAFRDEQHLPSTLLIVADHSESMTIQDQHNGQSRWDYLRRLLSDAEPQLQRLREEHNITVRLYRFAGQVSDYDPAGKADGKRTDFGEMLHTLSERHGTERLRVLAILSDGADNGTRYPAMSLASKWRTLPCPIYTFGFGQTTTTAEQRDIAFTDILSEPSPAVATKGKLTVKGRVDAPGFENREVRVHLLINDKEVVAGNARLQRVRDNEVKLGCDAPAEPGEIKVTLKIDPLPGETATANNEISTYVTVTREGISVLYVEGKVRAWEPKFIRWALSEEPSIVLSEAVLDSDAPLPPDQADTFDLEKKHYDVIILGDITPSRLRAANPGILETMKKLVFEKGTGLMMIGGYENFGETWAGTPIADVLPVQMDQHGQIEHRVRMEPTFDGLQHYVMRLADKADENKGLWRKLPELDAITRLGTPKLGSILLAESSEHEPVLVGQTNYGAGRTLAFAGDTTWRWHGPKTLKQHHRFWRQVVFWLAKRDKTDGNVQITPRARRIAAGDKLDFGVKLRGKGGMEIDKDAHFEVTVIDPQKVETKVPTARESGEERGTFWKSDLPGEYVIRARGWGTDVDGKPLEGLEPAEVRFMVYQDEAEMARQGADHEFLTKLANAGGGRFHSPEELIPFLKELGATPLPQNRLKAKLWPDWRRMPSSRSGSDQWSALASSGILVCFVLFVTLLCLEWFLRRYWGLV